MERATSALLLICGAAFAQQQGIFTDSRDGKRYKTVKIGEQVWMAENLDYNASSSKCYDNQSANCNKYGRLYNWNTALKACPSDWHLPSYEEWWTIRTNVGSVTKLKAKNGWNKNGNGTDEFGFSALPGGFGIPDGSFFGTVGNLGCWWSATKSKSNNDNAYGRCVGYDGTDEGFEDSKATTLSIRCVQNKAIIEAKEAANAAVQEGSFTDPRDGKTYKTVVIGTQTWMAENLNYAVEGSKCYDNDPDNCTIYGRFYNWNTALKACPSDWHLPNKDEWQKLVDFAGGDEVAGTYLKAKEGWAENGNGTDSYGFSALPGGGGYSDSGFSSFSNVGNNGTWWSASKNEYDSDYAYECDVRYDDEYAAGSSAIRAAYIACVASRTKA